MVKPPTAPANRLLYVEGGGDRNPDLASECRRAFSKLFEKAGIKNKPRVVVCGGRQNAYKQFRHAHEEGKDTVWLLVDAEECASADPAFDPWAHVKGRVGDAWERPSGATDDQLHLMNVVMEAWLLADRAALREVFRSGLDETKLPSEGAELEKKKKSSIYQSLALATQSNPTGPYGKGSHSFKILAEVSPQKLKTLPWARRFLEEMGG